MIGGRITIGRKAKDEAEKPFWISFGDLMSALMVLFLLVMSVALLAVTKTVNESERKKTERDQDIQQLLRKIAKASAQFPGVSVDLNRGVVDFQERARFQRGSSQLSPEDAKYLRTYIPVILAYANDKLGKKWLKRIVVEGFADTTGAYLLNLNLSLQRSQRVLCVLLAPSAREQVLSEEQLLQIRDLFFVGGYSFNSARKSLEASRRIELRLEFYGIDDPHPTPNPLPPGDFGDCKI